MVVKLNENETVIKASDSNYFNADARVEGKLILTNQRIYFKTVNDTAKANDFEVLFTQIREIMFFNTWKVIPNGLAVITKEGKELKFLVKNRDQWGTMINKMY
jgi:hypothetical protein